MDKGIPQHTGKRQETILVLEDSKARAQLSKSGAGIFVNRPKLNRAMSGLIRFSLISFFLSKRQGGMTTRSDGKM
jgi:hypothetical protein